MKLARAATLKSRKRASQRHSVGALSLSVKVIEREGETVAYVSKENALLGDTQERRWIVLVGALERDHWVFTVEKRREKITNNNNNIYSHTNGPARIRHKAVCVAGHTQDDADWDVRKKKKKPGAKRCKAKYLSEFCAKKKNAPLRKNFVYT